MVIMSITAENEHGNSKCSGASDELITHRAPLDCVSHVSEKRAASIFRVQVRRLT